MTPEAINAECWHRYRNRLGDVTQGRRPPTEDEKAMARAEADEWRASLEKPLQRPAIG